MTTTSDTTTEAAPSNAPLFYTRPVPLQADVHADLRILPGRLEFAAGNNAIPLVLGEFSLALHHFPILFAGPTAVPMAAVGVSDQNLFI
ncbi:TPA: SapC family protein, partial [Stenotrophomonas maltophilia]|nr:SapC family protein [Stenotrophomonas maltophilia]